MQFAAALKDHCTATIPSDSAMTVIYDAHRHELRSYGCFPLYVAVT